MVALAVRHWSVMTPRKRKHPEAGADQDTKRPRNTAVPARAPADRGRRGGARGRGRGGQRDGGNANRVPVANRGRKEGSNPVGEDGKKTQCFECGSEDHWAPNCPKRNAAVQEANTRGGSSKNWRRTA